MSAPADLSRLAVALSPWTRLRLDHLAATSCRTPEDQAAALVVQGLALIDRGWPMLALGEGKP
jgi:hypothetical protein